MTYEIGSILRRRLGGLFGLYGWHWGVYVGDGRVIHFNGERKKQRSATIRRDTLRQFSAGRTIIVHARPKSLAHGQAVRDEALRLYELAEANGFNGAYDFAFHNCHDFSLQCFGVEYEADAMRDPPPPSQREQLVHRSASVLAKVAATRIAKTGAKSGAKLAGKTAARAASPWFLIGDGAQLGAEVACTQLGCDSNAAERVGQGVGLCSAAGIGAALGSTGGPPGAAVGAAFGVSVWLSGEVIGTRVSRWAEGKSIDRVAE